mmetsp:Transcript_17828/g.53724  ORF Transcript_17828/g.53724 Transcript_17828/m.53724 type:complete len:813 (+) Transcript_17828:225-2663(+)|eukprot:CAMPEP_0206134742 /NCGR_PEP_ID=MMETSP1473-20131121/183_1 /ASSEMBLY_ACC=CAM_ASM_001109 /TAXON_ID=1461547 /ORGANISM="Stichococcus sp, Strain RCC1054" /LENGTH=812 /DNA_ID=CAMNT_0053526363 /DNA_START=176 /DNA_END=2614 /DNA_ORIENTATION=-
MNFKSFKAALGQAVATGTSYAKDLSTQVVGAKVLRDYTVGPQTASSGLWRIYSARCKREGSAHSLVSVWILDRRAPDALRHGKDNEGAWEAIQELARKNVANLTRLKHPGILKLVEPFEETRQQMVLVTECVLLSLGNVLSHCEGLPHAVQQEHAELEMSDLERKHGLLQIADTLHFLHAEANLIHSGLCPDAVLLTGGGAWKLASLAHTTQVEYAVGDGEARTFDYSDSSDAARLQAPPLQYVAPELITTPGVAQPAQSPASDMFSLGCLSYELLSGSPLMPQHCSVADHQGRVAGLAFMDFGAVEVQAQPVVKGLLSGTPSVRPSATAFMGAAFFQDDVLVRSLRFLDNLLQRDNLQKAAFLKDALKFWPRFNLRVLRYKVLPPLLAELRNEKLQALVLPLVLNIIPRQEAQDFMDWTLPALQPIATSAKGDALTVFTRNAALLATSMPPEAVRLCIVPLLVRAADQGDAQAQEEMVKAVPMLAEIVAYEDMKADLLPRLCGLCLGTTSASVRTAALLSMGKLLPSIELDEAKKMMTVCGKVTTVDQTPGTVMCVVGLGTAVAKQYGAEAGARTSLPIMTPCLAAPALTPQQYATAMRAVREILTNLDASKGITGSAAATPSAAGSNKSSASSLPALEQSGSQAGGMTAAFPPISNISPTGSTGSGSFGAAPASPGRGSLDTGGRTVLQQPPRPSPLAPPAPAKANTLADAFSSLGDPPSTGGSGATMGMAPSQTTDDMFDFQPISRASAVPAQPAAAKSPIMGKGPILGKAPLLGQPPGAPVQQQHPGFGSFQSSSGPPPDNFGSGSLI